MGNRAFAQDVYNYVLETAEKVVNNPLSTYTNIKISQFKYTSLKYIKRKALEKNKEVSNQFLDVQAYNMSEFLSLFFKEAISKPNLSPERKKELIFMFMDASCSNPLFEDEDIETTQSYISEGNELTPFSLDTDWEKALAAANAQLKK